MRRLIVAAAVAAVCCVRLQPAFAADPKKTDDDALPKLLWRAPRHMSSRDWVCGPGGCDRTPTPPFAFAGGDTGGTNPKLNVKDAKGLSWSVKLGAEVIPECFGSRFVTALGYFAEQTYFVASGKIEGLKQLPKLGSILKKDGSFTNARFELRGGEDLVFLPHRPWGWANNPFRGSHELAGLKIVMMLLSNWDAKDDREGDESNNNIFRAKLDSGPALLYSVTDWGASLGRWGNARRRDQSDCSGFTRDDPKFIRGGSGSAIEWGYAGKHDVDIRSGVGVDDVSWLLTYVRPISDNDLRTGLKASGATERQATCWAAAIRNRVRQLEVVAR